MEQTLKKSIWQKIICMQQANRKETELLEDLKAFNNSLSHFFEETKSVKEVVYKASRNINTEISFEALRIYRLLCSRVPREGLSQYETDVSSRHLRKIVRLLVLVQENGDGVTESGTDFVQKLNLINQEIHEDIRYGRLLVFRNWGSDSHLLRLHKL